MRYRRVAFLSVIVACFEAGVAVAHPLGNFSVNRWAAIQSGDRAIRVEYAVDFAEIPTFQESPAIDTDRDGRGSDEEIRHFATTRAETLGADLELVVGGVKVPLQLVSSRLRFAPGAAGLRTMRLTASYRGDLPSMVPEVGVSVSFRDHNFAGRAGWRELIAYGDHDSAVVDSSVPASDLSHALSSYPVDLIQAPPQVGEADFRLLTGNAAGRARSAGIALIKNDDPGEGRRPPPSLSDGLTRLVGEAGGEGRAGILVAVLASALFWGAAHALSPGHGKTVVAAYLVGQRGTPLHAVWLGLIVTVTHTAGVFVLGALTLLLSRWFVPEALYPWLEFSSGLTVLVMGATLLYRRLLHVPGARHDHDHSHEGPAGLHRHAPDGHTHNLPETLSFRGLLALGISGGIVPCPSALVVLLSAVAFHRILFGTSLILAFSVGLAAVLVAVGLLMVYARGLFDRFELGASLSRRLGVLSAAAMTLLGAGLAANSLPAVAVAASIALLPLGATAGVLGLGMLFGLKHATEADHMAAVGAIVSEQGGLRRALWTGGLWGTGHTISIVVAGLFVLGLHLAIPESMAHWLEFGVALMIIGLGSTALGRALRNRPDAHVHRHAHDSRDHGHLHFHEAGDQHHPFLDSDPPRRFHGVHTAGTIGLKPLCVGMMHGLAGSAALTLLVLGQIPSAGLGLIYLLVFGLGSIGGMVLMSLAISLPFAATVSRPEVNRGIRIASGALSLSFGLFYAYYQLG